MTSKTSFFKSMQEDMRHRIWVPALSAIVFLLALIFTTLYVQSLSLEYVVTDSENTAYLLNRLCNIYNRNGIIFTLIACTGAVICAIQGFAYLFNKCQLDFYHALPVKRERFFLVRWANGILFYLVPAFIFSAISVIVAGAFHMLNAATLTAIAVGFFHNLLIFFLVYHAAILVCMLTGNTLIALGLFGILAVYPYMITQLVPSFLNVYYETYTDFSIGMAEYLNYLSPAWLTVKLSMPGSIGNYLYTILYTAVLLGISIVLYRMRALENSQKAIVFPGLCRILRILLVIPVALYAGLFFGQLSSGFHAFWSIIGLIIFLVLTHAILEVIFTFDIHAAFHHKKEVLACAICCLAFMIIFLTDAPQLDKRLPAKESVKAVYLDLPVDNDMNYLTLEKNTYISLTSYRLEHAILTGDDIDKAYALLDYRVLSDAPQPEAEIAYDEKTTAVSAENPYLYTEFNLNIRFVKNNGQSEYRTFKLPVAQAKDAMAAVYNTPSFKHGHYQIFDPAMDSLFDQMTLTDATDAYIIRNTTYTNLFTEQETIDYMAVLRKDLASFTYENLITEIPIGSVNFYSDSTGRGTTYYIYPSFKETITWMNAHGVDFDGWKQNNPIVLTIRKDEVYNESYSPDEPELEVEYGTTFTDEAEQDTDTPSNIITITDAETIALFYPYLYNQRFVYRTTFNEMNANVYHNYYATITWDSNNDVNASDFYIGKDFKQTALLP